MRNFLLVFFVCALAYADSAYYRLQGYDSGYRLLDDAPIIQKKKPLKSNNSQNRASRPKREQSTKRIDISPPALRNGSNAGKWDSSRIKPTPNEPARIRYGFPPYPRQHFIMVGLNSGVDIFTAESSLDSAKKAFAVELMGKFGYFYFFTRDNDSHSMRIYAHFGTSIPTNKAIPANIAFGANIDFLINVIYFDLFLGAGYGGEYFIRNATLSHGALVNTGFSKRIGNHQLEVGVRVPFFTMPDSALNHNIDIVLSYNYIF